MDWQKIKWGLLGLAGWLLLAGCAGQPGPTAALPDVMFMDWDANGRIQLFSLKPGEEAHQITQEAADIVAFAPAPDGRTIAYIVAGQAGHEIWLVEWNGRSAKAPRLLLSCDEARCDPLVWHPDGRRLIYEKRAWDTPNRPYLWWLDTHTGETITVLADTEEVSAGAALSPDGQWLSYVSPRTDSMQVYNLESGEQFEMTHVMGSPAIWRPDSRQILIRDLDQLIYHGGEGEDHTSHDHDFAEAIHLFVGEVPEGGRQVIDETGNVDDANPAWSPDGRWIAFGRKIARTQTARQLWLARPDGSEARPLTEGYILQHGQPHWSPDGRYLLFQRADLSLANPQPSLWLLNVATDEMQELRPSGMLPVWLPES